MVEIMMAVNDSHGRPQRHVDAISIGEIYLVPPGHIRYVIGTDFLRLHGIKFQIKDHREWTANWCWDSLDLDVRETLRFCRLLKRQGWFCEDGPERVCAWFNGREMTGHSQSSRGI